MDPVLLSALRMRAAGGDPGAQAQLAEAEAAANTFAMPAPQASPMPYDISGGAGMPGMPPGGAAAFAAQSADAEADAAAQLAAQAQAAGNVHDGPPPTVDLDRNFLEDRDPGPGPAAQEQVGQREPIQGSFGGSGGAPPMARMPVAGQPRRGGGGGGAIRAARQRKNEALESYEGIQGARADSARDMGDEFRAGDDTRRDIELDRDEELRRTLDPMRAATDEADRLRAEARGKVERANVALNETPRKAVISRKTKIIGALQVMLGGHAQIKTAFGSGANIGNQGIQLMERAVQRELDDHERVLEGKREGVSTAQNELAIAREHYGDTQEAMQRADIAIREKYSSQIRSEGDTLKSKQQQAAAYDVADGLDAGTEERKYQLEAATEQGLMRQAAAVGRARQKQLQAAQQAAHDQALGDRRLAATGLSRTDPEIYASLPKKLQQEIITGSGQIGKARGYINKIKKLRTEVGAARNLPRALQSKEMTRLNGQLSSFANQLKLVYKSPSMADLGVIAGADLDLIDGVTGDPDSFWESDSLSKIEAMDEGLTSGFNAENAGNGVRIGVNAEGRGRRR